MITTNSSALMSGTASFMYAGRQKEQEKVNVDSCTCKLELDSLDKLSDEQLAVAYMKGNCDAFDVLLERNKSKLFSYILFVVHNRDLANDVFQDTFVKVIIRLQNGEYSPTGKFSAWVTRIAHNIIMDHYRSMQNGNIVDIDVENDAEQSPVLDQNLLSMPIESYFVNEQVLSQVKNLMNMLPPLQREVVFMRFFQELSFKEIAEATGVSINTSLGRMRYAVLNLRRMVRRNNIELQLL